MRNTKELLLIVLSKKYLFRFGLCQWIKEVAQEGHITIPEYEYLNIYIELHPPMFLSIRESLYNDYYWNVGDIKPRIKWLKKHIGRN